MRAVVVAVVMALTTVGCGQQATDSAAPALRSDATASASASTTASASPGSAMTSKAPSVKERLTPGGIAVVVREHVGAGRVATFGSYGGEPGSVNLMIRLRGGNRADNFMVQVYSPKQGKQGLAELSGCPHGKKAKASKDMQEFTCHRLPNGTTVSSFLTPYGFSDDNSRGHVISGTAAEPHGSIAMAMYESYERSAPISVADVDKLLSDPRLTWMTDPAVNAAGEQLHIQKLDG